MFLFNMKFLPTITPVQLTLIINFCVSVQRLILHVIGFLLLFGTVYVLIFFKCLLIFIFICDFHPFFETLTTLNEATNLSF